MCRYSIRAVIIITILFLIFIFMETTKQLYEIENGAVLDISGRVCIESLSINMDGIFPRLCDWSRFFNKIDQDGPGGWIEKNFSGYGIQSINETKKYGIYTVLFEKPIEILLATIEGKPVTAKAQLFTAEISCEFYRNLYDGKNFPQWEKSTNIEIFFENIKTV